MSEPTNKPVKAKKRSPATGRGDVRRLVKSLGGSITASGVSTLLSIARAEVEALMLVSLDIMSQNETKTFNTRTAAAAVRIRYTDKELCNFLLDGANQATTKYKASHT